jgi:hypothetical protein
MKTATKVVYLAILVVVSAVPIIIWSQDPSVDLAGVGAFVAGLGVPMGTLTAAMAARGISRDRKRGDTMIDTGKVKVR